MSREQEKTVETESAVDRQPSGAPASQSEVDVRRLGRRALLKAGLIAVPLVLTFKSQPVWALREMHASGASPWYRGPWDENGNVLKEDWDQVDSNNDGNFADEEDVLKYREPLDAPSGWMGPTGGSDESDGMGGWLKR